MYYLAPDGRVLGRAPNGRLTFLSGPESSVRQVLWPSWSDETGLVAYTLVERTPAGAPAFRIAVGDLAGRVHRAYGDGGHYDTRPRWAGPRTVVFDRAPSASAPWTAHRAMALDTETGAVRELVDPAVFGALGTRMPDAGL